MRCLLIVAMLMGIAPPEAGARPAAVDTFYVAMQGDDAGDGSAAAPWATLQHAADEAATPGDVVLVEDGTYAGFETRHAGITFQANGAAVVIDRPGEAAPQDHVNVEGHDGVVIAGFVVRDAPRAGIRVVEASGVVVRGNTVGPNGKWGIFSGFAPQIQVLGNVTFGSADEHGIYLSNSRGPDDGVVVRGNTSFGNNANGIQLNGDCHAGGDGTLDGGIIENNVVYGNRFKGLSIISAPGVRIQNNVIYDNGLDGGAAGIHLVDEPGCGKPTVGAVVVNNTVIEPRIAAIRINDGAVENVLFNNLLVSDRPLRDEVGGNRIDDASNLAQASAAGLFADAAMGDYRLAAGSPAIDQGRARYEDADAPATDFGGTLRPQGAAPDAGAYEAAAPTAAGPGEAVPARVVLEAVYPNPARRDVVVRYTLAEARPVELAVYDLQGRRVATLAEGVQPPGEHAAYFAAAMHPAGVYFVCLRAGTSVRTQAVVRVD